MKVLRFDSENGAKWYAQTPDGEYAWSDRQGLYRWFRDTDGTLQRVAYTGGDQQASDPIGPWTRHGRPEPNIRGIAHGLWRYQYGVN